MRQQRENPVKSSNLGTTSTQHGSIVILMYHTM